MWTVFKAAPSTTEYFNCVCESIVIIGMMRNENIRLYRCVVCGLHVQQWDRCITPKTMENDMMPLREYDLMKRCWWAGISSSLFSRRCANGKHQCVGMQRDRNLWRQRARPNMCIHTYKYDVKWRRTQKCFTELQLVSARPINNIARRWVNECMNKKM